MRKSIFKFASALGIFLLVAVTLTGCSRDQTSIVTPQIQDKVNEAYYQAQDRIKQEEAMLAPQFEEKADPEPTPEPLPPIQDFCARMSHFDYVNSDVKEMTKFEVSEYWRGRNAFISALRYKLDHNPYGQFSRCGEKDGYSYQPEVRFPSVYLLDYREVIPRSLQLRALRPEIADTLRALRRSASVNELYNIRGELRDLPRTWELSRAEFVFLGLTNREILEAEIDFSPKEKEEE